MAVNLLAIAGESDETAMVPRTNPISTPSAAAAGPCRRETSVCEAVDIGWVVFILSSGGLR
ncbi:MAG: hypothetical protein H0T52_04255 [Lautropia sp.]|nr:hypothetical protein [Lautropia sp.]